MPSKITSPVLRASEFSKRAAQDVSTVESILRLHYRKGADVPMTDETRDDVRELVLDAMGALDVVARELGIDL